MISSLQLLRGRFFIALFAGLAFLFAFPPSPLGFLAPLSLAAILHLSLTAPNKKQAFLLPFFSGLISAAGLLYWMPRLMGEGLYAVLAVGMVLLFSYMAAWVGLVGLLTYQLSRIKPMLGWVAFPFLWVAQEKLRELGEISFPWITTGYAYGHYTSLLQALSFFGVYFYSLLITVTAVLLLLAVRLRNQKKKAILLLLPLLFLYTTLFLTGQKRIARFDSFPHTTIRCALIQSNIDPLIKWRRDRTDSIFLLHCDMTREAAAQKPDFTLWPESAIPAYFSRELTYRFFLDRLVDSINSPLIFGSLDVTLANTPSKRPDYFNSVFFKAPRQEYIKYDKIRLLPFAERLPFEGLFPIISKVDLGEADFTSGDTLMIFSIPKAKLFAPICYEVVYPDCIRQFVNNGGTLLAQVTNDGWFGRSAMPWQHLNIARTRCIENGIPMARCANTGVCAAVDACGRVISQTAIFENRILIADIPTTTLPTAFRKNGDTIGWFSLWLSLIAVPLLLLFKALKGRKR